MTLIKHKIINHRRRLLSTLILAVCAFTTSANAQTPPKGVIFVLTDDTGYGDIDALYPSSLNTPSLDSLARESVRLTDFHVGTTCAPSRAALMTGREMNATGVWHTVSARELLREDEQTMAEVFQANDWNTGIFGKWHLGDGYPFSPRFRGFDQSVIHGGGGVTQLGDYWGNDYYSGVDRSGRANPVDVYFENGEPVIADEFVTDYWFTRAKEFIAESVTANERFFAYIPTNAAHSPFNAPFGYKAGVDGLIENIDDNMSWLDDFLTAQGIKDDVLLIFSTDNGTVTSRRGGLRDKKDSHYDGGHNVPMFMRWKNGGIGGSSASARDVETLSAGMDLLPTFIDWFNLDRPEGGKPFDGMSLVDAITDPGYEAQPRTHIVDTQRVAFLTKYKEFSVMHDEVDGNGNILHKWRLVRESANAAPELYDLLVDRGQTNNIINQHPAVVSMLQDEYEDWWNYVSAGQAAYEPFVIDLRRDDELLITSHDDITSGISVFSQGLVRNANRRSTGLHALHFAEAGRYRFELRRWPTEDGGSLDGRARTTSGTTLPITRASLRLEGIGSYTTNIVPGSASVAFELDVPAGHSGMLETAFLSGSNFLTGAFFTYITKVSTPTIATVFERPNRGGPALSLGVGAFPINVLRNSGIGNDAVSSLTVAPGYTARLCSHSNQTARNQRCVNFNESADSLPLLDNQTSYVAISRNPVSTCAASSNVAPLGVATQSSDWFAKFNASAAIDGNVTTFSHTAASHAFAGWQVTLDKAYAIESIRLQNRRHTPTNSRLRDVFVRVRDAAGAVVYSSGRLNGENALDSPQTLELNLPAPVTGHSVEVVREPDPDLSGYSGGNVLHDTDVLALAEVEVFGCSAN